MPYYLTGKNRNHIYDASQECNNYATKFATCDRRTSLYVPISLKAIVNLFITGPEEKQKQLFISINSKHIELFIRSHAIINVA